MAFEEALKVHGVNMWITRAEDARGFGGRARIARRLVARLGARVSRSAEDGRGCSRSRQPSTELEHGELWGGTSTLELIHATDLLSVSSAVRAVVHIAVAVGGPVAGALP